MRTTLAVALVVVFACLGSTAWGAGLYLYEIGSPDVGLASAGYPTRAGDAATLFTNPAGMTRLGQMELLVGGQLLYGNLTFETNANTRVPGGGGGDGNAVGWLPGGSFFFVAEPAPTTLPRLKVGLGLLSALNLRWVL